jgi:ferritin-like protein
MHYLMQFFAFDHLPPRLQDVSRPFSALAASLDATLPGNPEKTAALRFLLQAKDCAIRATLFEPS